MARHWGENILIYGDYVRSEASGITTKNPNQENWERTTQDLLRSIQATRVGSVLLRLINATPRSLTIRPLASALLLQTASAANTPVHAGAAGVPLKPKSPEKADGRGSGVTIWFDPDTWSGTAKNTVDPGNHMQPDDVLFHEMVHALRAMRGRMTAKDLDFWDNKEELIAVLLTNIYLADNGRPDDLRGSHNLPFEGLGSQHQFAAPQPSENMFYREYSDEIDELCTTMPDLCEPISTLTTWNPIRARKTQPARDAMFR